MGTWIAGAVVLAVIVLAARGIYKGRKSGNTCGCGCDSCSGCPKVDRRTPA